MKNKTVIADLERKASIQEYLRYIALLGKKRARQMADHKNEK